MRDGHLLRRAGREFTKNLIWMVVVFGVLAAILVAATELPLVGVMVFVGASAPVVAAVVTMVGVGMAAEAWTAAVGETRTVFAVLVTLIHPSA